MSKIILHQTYYLVTYFYVLKHFQNAVLLQMQLVDFIECFTTKLVKLDR